jgi:hypothetical protein
MDKDSKRLTLSSLKMFSKLVTETRNTGHCMYFVSKKGKWCLRFNTIYRDRGSVAFFGDDPDEAMSQAVEFIKLNRVEDEGNVYRPFVIS